MKKFLEKLSEFIKINKLIKPKDKIVVGFSGGVDSTALLHSLWQLSSEIGFYIIAAHVNYNLRGIDSNNDEEFVRKICEKFNIPLLVKQAKIDSKKSIELNAREIRREFFKNILKFYKADNIALGHNANDQSETILLNLFRGAGTNGLKGILPKNDYFIHPFIEFTRSEIEEYLTFYNLEYRTDKSNFENIYSRNKIRNIFIPYILENINPKFIEKTIYTAKIFRETEKIISNLASKTISNLLEYKNEDKYVLSLKKLVKQNSVMRFYFYKKLHFLLTGTEKDFFSYHFAEIEKILKSEGSKQISLPAGITVLKEYDTLTFQKTSSIQKTDTNNQRKIEKIRARIKFENYRLYFKKLKKLSENYRKDKNSVVMDLDKIKFPLILRHRKNGDKFIPVGHSHKKKLKEFFIDKKISKFRRDKILIMEDSEKILWVVGYSMDNRVAIDKNTTNFLVIHYEFIKYPKKRMAKRFKRLLY